MIFIFCSSSRSIFPPGLVENSNMGEEGLSSFDCANFICYPCMWDYLLARKHAHIAAQARIHKYSTAHQVRDTFFHWFYIFILILWEGNKETTFRSLLTWLSVRSSVLVIGIKKITKFLGLTEYKSGEFLYNHAVSNMTKGP